MASSSSPMDYSATNNSCNPWVERTAYVIDATEVSHLQKGVDFARRHNIRLVVRNTGHDYLGRSTGAHSLALWTHNLKSTGLLEYHDSKYVGPAIKLGAGVLVGKAIRFANSHNPVVVGGNGPTVGIAGGFTQGGGIGPLSSIYGLSADQVLEWAVITADEKLVTANCTDNPDLYWALRGGGGGTPFYTAFKGFLTAQLLGLVDRGLYVVWVLTPALFYINARYAFGMYKGELDELPQPTLSILTDAELQYAYNSFAAPTFLSAFETTPGSWNVFNHNAGGRLIPRSLLESDPDGLIAALREIGMQALLTGVSFNVEVTKSSLSSAHEVAVNPYLRESIMKVFFGAPLDYQYWDANLTGMDKITNYYLRGLERLTPNGGAYLNEADVGQLDFLRVFHGDYYSRLAEIKQRYDPDGLYYAKTAVGSEKWEEKSNGRLCKAKGQ
ncbi:hypothetical protein VTK26DRAFT_6231 [Humicola hyalothermophila]